jgi:hypothetical protein
LQAAGIEVECATHADLADRAREMNIGFYPHGNWQAVGAHESSGES